MAHVVDITEAQRDLSRLLERADQGEEVVNTRGGKPVARLVPIASPRKQRVLAQAAGQVWIAPHFDELPANNIQAAFDGDR